MPVEPAWVLGNRYWGVAKSRFYVVNAGIDSFFLIRGLGLKQKSIVDRYNVT